MNSLHLSPDLALPLDAITRTFGILAQRGAGKTSTAAVIVEEMLGSHLPVVVLDPTGAWWGLRSNASGTGPGLPITILGGDHGDLPLESTAGAVVADLVVDERASIVLDLSTFSGNEQRRFVTDFAERLYRRNRQPLHVVIDEADEFCPQRIMHGAERMVGAIDRMVRRGRIRGLGVTLISQRAAVIHKDVLTQIDTLIVLRTTGPQDRAAIDAWVSQHGSSAERERLMNGLASLPVGTAWVWSPGWLHTFRKVAVRRRRTFDSGATPTVGGSAVTPRKLAPVDLDRVRARMAETIERVKLDDPAVLRARIAELERSLRERPTVAEVIRAEAFVPPEVCELLTALVTKARGDVTALERALSQVQSLARKHPTPKVSAKPSRPAPPVSVPTKHVDSGGALRGAERKLLTALAQYPEGRSKTQLAILTSYASCGGAFNNYLSSFNSRGFIEREDEVIRITDAGRKVLGSFVPLPTGSALLEHWRSRLGKAERSILDVLVEAREGLSKEDVAVRAGYEARGGGFNNALSRLRTLELIEGRDTLRASAALREVLP